MQKFSYGLLVLPLMLGTLAHAQTAGTITFTAKQASATGSLAPVLTWSTTPVASSCTASGAWSGAKFASGTETLATITASKSYTLTCVWGNGSATLDWTAPTKNTDGTALTDLAGYKVVFGSSATALSQSMSISSPTATSTTVPALASGTWFMAVRSVNSKQVESANSSVVQKVVSSASASKSVNITITAATTLKLKTLGGPVYDIYLKSDYTRLLYQQVGTVGSGYPCDETYKQGTDYYRVNRNYVTLTVTPRSHSVVTRCAKS